MSDWTFTTGNPLTRKAWAKDWWMVAKTEAYFYENGFVGTSEDNIIVDMPDLEAEQGDQITYGQVRELSGGGRINDDIMEGFEEAPETYDDAITIAQIRNAVRLNGRESNQRPSDKKLREKAKTLLKRWMSGNIDQAIFTALGSSLTKVIYGGDATATTDIEAGDYMTLSLISKCVAYAKKASPMITGPTVKGKQIPGVIVVHTDQAFDITERDASWNQSRMEAAIRGMDNPIFTGALGAKGNVPIHEHTRVAVATTWGSGGNLNGATALFMGIQSGVIAYAVRKIWEEKTFDYQNKVGFCIGALYGCSKSVFNSADNAVVGIRTYRTSN